MCLRHVQFVSEMFLCLRQVRLCTCTCYFHLTTACIFIQRLPMFYMQHQLFILIFLSHEAAICLSVHLYVF